MKEEFGRVYFGLNTLMCIAALQWSPSIISTQDISFIPCAHLRKFTISTLNNINESFCFPTIYLSIHFPSQLQPSSLLFPLAPPLLEKGKPAHGLPLLLLLLFSSKNKNKGFEWMSLLWHHSTGY